VKQRLTEGWLVDGEQDVRQDWFQRKPLDRGRPGANLQTCNHWKRSVIPLRSEAKLVPKLTSNAGGGLPCSRSGSGAHVAIQGYVQASAGQAFVLQVTRDPNFIRGLEGFALVLEVDGLRTEFRPELCGPRGAAPPDWKLDGNFSGKPSLLSRFDDTRLLMSNIPPLRSFDGRLVGLREPNNQVVNLPVPV
jgi:hypothetical protein